MRPRLLGLASLSLCAPAALALSPAGDDSHADWIPLLSIDHPIQEPLVGVVGELSGVDRTVLDVEIPGVFAANHIGEDGETYTRIWLPGSGAHTLEWGAPELPVLRFLLAVPPGTGQVELDDEPGLPGVTIYLDLNHADALPDGLDPGTLYPVHEPGWDPDPDAGLPLGQPPVFHFDEQVYDGSTLYPATLADKVVSTHTLLGGVDAALIELRPFRWEPDTQRIEVRTQFRVAFDHPAVATGLTSEVAPGAARYWGQISMNYEQIEITYHEDAAQGETARMLMLAEREHLDELLPLIHQRQLSGLEVEFLALEDLGDTTSVGIRAALGAWADEAPQGVDSYALLVGDVDRIPLHASPQPKGVPSDAAYRRPLDARPELELYLGRLSIDDEQDLEHQIAKILAYEQPSEASPTAFRQLGLAVHNYAHAPQPPPSEFAQDIADAVASGGSGLEPTPFAGTASGVHDALLKFIDEGLGALVYRGAASVEAWPDWTLAGDDFDPAAIQGLLNPLPFPHYGFGPATAGIAHDDSLAEAWMSAPRGAMQAVGFAGPLQSEVGDALTRGFGQLRDHGLWVRTGKTMAAVVLASSLDARADLGGASADGWMFLGDPAVPHRTPTETDFTVILEEELVLDADGGSLQVLVQDANGNPVDDFLVSVVVGSSSIGSKGELVQPIAQARSGGVGGQSSVDFEDIVFTTKLGKHVPGSVQVLLADGSVQQASIQVQLGSFVDLGGAVGNSIGIAPDLLSVDTIAPAATLEFVIQDAAPLSAGVLFLALENNAIPYAGGFFHPNPVLLSFPFATNLDGKAQVFVGPLPPALPSGLKLVLQAAVADISGPGGITLSNGLVGAP